MRDPENAGSRIAGTGFLNSRPDDTGSRVFGFSRICPGFPDFLRDFSTFPGIPEFFSGSGKFSGFLFFVVGTNNFLKS